MTEIQKPLKRKSFPIKASPLTSYIIISSPIKWEEHAHKTVARIKRDHEYLFY